MKFRQEIIFGSFIVALLSSFIVVLAGVLLRAVSLSRLHSSLLGEVTFEMLILLFFAAFVFFKGSAVAAWFIFRHDVPWGYRVHFKMVLPLFVTSFLMAAPIFFAVYFFSIEEIVKLAETLPGRIPG